jgi:hypothetical protein
MTWRTCLQSAAMSIGFLAPLLPADAFGIIAAMGGEALLEHADVVARIRIIDVEEHPGPHTHVLPNTKISQVEIVDSIKGPAAKEIIRIEHDNGATCPNVRYYANREYLVFARAIPGTDLYVTLNYYEGSYRIENGVVEGYGIFDESTRRQPKQADAVIADLRERWKRTSMK